MEVILSSMASLRLLATSGILHRNDPLWVEASDAWSCNSNSDMFTCKERAGDVYMYMYSQLLRIFYGIALQRYSVCSKYSPSYCVPSQLLVIFMSCASAQQDHYTLAFGQSTNSKLNS